MGGADETTSWMQESARVQPNPENQKLYDELFAHYLELYPATKDVAHYLAEHQING